MAEFEQGDLVRGTGRQQHKYVVLEQKVPNDRSGRFSLKCFDLNDMEVAWCDPDGVEATDRDVIMEEYEAWEEVRVNWPKHEDGTPVRVGEWYVADDGQYDELRSVSVDANGYALLGEVHDDWRKWGTPVVAVERTCKDCKFWQAAPDFVNDLGETAPGVCWRRHSEGRMCYDAVYRAGAPCPDFEARG